MADSSKPVDAKLLRQRRAEFIKRAAEQFDRDMEQMSEIAAKYGIVIGDVAAGESKPAKSHDVSSGPGVASAEPMTVQITKAAEVLFRRRGTRIQSGEIAKVLVAQGLAITGDAGSKVSSYLTRAKKIFDNKPEFGGYGLVEWNGARSAPGKKVAG